MEDFKTIVFVLSMSELNLELYVDLTICSKNLNFICFVQIKIAKLINKHFIV